MDYGPHYCLIEEGRVMQCSAVPCSGMQAGQGKEKRMLKAGHFQTMSPHHIHDYTSTSDDSAEPLRTPHHPISCHTMSQIHHAISCYSMSQIHQALSLSAELRTHHYDPFLPFIYTCPSLSYHLAFLPLPLPLPH